MDAGWFGTLWIALWRWLSFNHVQMITIVSDVCVAVVPQRPLYMRLCRSYVIYNGSANTWSGSLRLCRNYKNSCRYSCRCTFIIIRRVVSECILCLRLCRDGHCTCGFAAHTSSTTASSLRHHPKNWSSTTVKTEGAGAFPLSNTPDSSFKLDDEEVPTLYVRSEEEMNRIRERLAQKWV